MTFTVGRFAGEDVAAVDVMGDRVTFEVDLLATDLAHLQAVTQQLAGLVDDDDDPVVPVTWSEDATIDGFYRVLDVSIPNAELRLTVFYLSGVRIALERIAGYTAPLVEFDASAVVRTNAISIISGEPIALVTAFHESASTYDSVTSGSLFVSRTGEDGDVYVAGDDAPFTRTSNQFPSIGNRYSGCCKVEVRYGSTWYPVIGQQVPESAAGNWRISNSLVRFTYVEYSGTGGADVGGLQVEVWDAAAWRDTVTMKFGTWDGAAFSDGDWVGGAGIGSSQTGDGGVVASPVRVLRNSPETVTLGFFKANTGTQFISLDMGAMFCTLTSRAIGAVEPMLRPVGSEFANGFVVTGSGGLSGGITRTSNDANGNRYVIIYTANTGMVQQNGGLRHGSNITSGTAVTWGIGVELDGSSAATGNTADELAQQYLGQAAWRQRVVVR